MTRLVVNLTVAELQENFDHWLEWLDITGGHIGVFDENGEVTTYLIPYDQYEILTGET